MDPVSATIGGGLAILGGATSVASAREQNRNIRRNIDEQRRVAQDSINQNAVAATRDRAARLRAMQQAVGRARVAFRGADALPFVGMAAAESESNIRAAQDEFAARGRSIGSQFTANAYRLRDQRQNVLLAGLQGAMQGASTGLAIGQGVTALRNLPPVPDSPYPFLTGMPGTARPANPYTGWGTP
jgi:hypothetical protein